MADDTTEPVPFGGTSSGEVIVKVPRTFNRGISTVVARQYEQVCPYPAHLLWPRPLPVTYSGSVHGKVDLTASLEVVFFQN